MSKTPSGLSAPESFFGSNLLPFAARTVGFEQLFNTLDAFRASDIPKYPPYNIVKTGEGDYQVVVAVAGLSKDDIKVEHDKQELVISHTLQPATEPAEIEPMFIHKGLAARDFVLRFKIAADVEVTDATHENGLLTVKLHHVTSKEKPKLIPIT